MATITWVGYIARGTISPMRVLINFIKQIFVSAAPKYL